MRVEITPQFHDNDSIAKAFKEANSNGFMLIWSTIAKRVLQSGTHMRQAKKINAVSKVIEVDNIVETASFRAMEKFGMVRIVDDEVKVSTLGEDKYEEWLALYPYRDVNGKRVKVRGKSRARFHNQIRNEETFRSLIGATSNYAQMCNKFPKDPERFLLNDFWKEYVTTESIRPEAIDSASIDELMR